MNSICANSLLNSLRKDHSGERTLSACMGIIFIDKRPWYTFILVYERFGTSKEVKTLITEATDPKPTKVNQTILKRVRFTT